MVLPKSDPVTNTVPPRLIDAVKQLAEIVDAKSVRVWRYVDSQNALFGFWAEPALPQHGDKPHLAFDDFVAFLRQPEKLEKYAADYVAGLSDEENPDSPGRRHPRWDVPEYMYLPKQTTTNYIESILVNDRDS